MKSFSLILFLSLSTPIFAETSIGDCAHFDEARCSYDLSTCKSHARREARENARKVCSSRDLAVYETEIFGESFEKKSFSGIADFACTFSLRFDCDKIGRQLGGR